jgi:hypothetical protein
MKPPESRRGLAHFAESSAQNVPVPFTLAAAYTATMDDKEPIDEC